MKVFELSTRLGVPYRHVRYVFEQGILPAGVEIDPGRGEHRDLDYSQAFWMAIVLVLKENGIRTPLAGQIADFARDMIREITQNANWESQFEPFFGHFDSEFQWFIDIGDLKYVRVATTANPSQSGKLYEHPWSIIGQRKSADVAPVVIIRLDINRLVSIVRD